MYCCPNVCEYMCIAVYMDASTCEYTYVYTGWTMILDPTYVVDPLVCTGPNNVYFLGYHTLLFNAVQCVYTSCVFLCYVIHVLYCTVHTYSGTCLVVRT